MPQQQYQTKQSQRRRKPDAQPRSEQARDLVCVTKRAPGRVAAGVMLLVCSFYRSVTRSLGRRCRPIRPYLLLEKAAKSVGASREPSLPEQQLRKHIQRKKERWIKATCTPDASAAGKHVRPKVKVSSHGQSRVPQLIDLYTVRLPTNRRIRGGSGILKLGGSTNYRGSSRFVECTHKYYKETRGRRTRYSAAAGTAT